MKCRENHEKRNNLRKINESYKYNNEENKSE